MLDCIVAMWDCILEKPVTLHPNLGWPERRWGYLGYNWGLVHHEPG